ncbi:MAG: hypothetical protein DWI54_04500 [Chloroflexi bacterium]|nr:MAG: hypothetical protein DWI54_04500 [Chloroflexota bacterium]
MSPIGRAALVVCASSLVLLVVVLLRRRLANGDTSDWFEPIVSLTVLVLWLVAALLVGVARRWYADRSWLVVCAAVLLTLAIGAILWALIGAWIG